MRKTEKYSYETNRFTAGLMDKSAAFIIDWIYLKFIVLT